MNIPRVQPWREHHLAGHPDQIGNALARAATCGQLVSMGTPRQLADGRVAVTVLLRNTIRPATRPTTHQSPRPVRPATTRKPGWRIGVAVTVGITLGGGIATAIYLILRALLHAMLWLLPEALGLVVVLVAIAAIGPTVARHCPGCRD